MNCEIFISHMLAGLICLVTEEIMLPRDPYHPRESRGSKKDIPNVSAWNES